MSGLQNKECHVALCAMSDPVCNDLRFVAGLVDQLEARGIAVDVDQSVLQDLPPEEKAQCLNALFAADYDWILDISGGNLANLILPFIEWKTYSQSKAFMAGFSDLSVVLNALAFKAKKKTLLLAAGYQRDFDRLASFLKGESGDIVSFSLQTGKLPDSFPSFAGGNLRCFMKLMGTDFQPKIEGQVLFLEAMGGSQGVICSLLAQAAQAGYFKSASGVLFGCFSELDQNLGEIESTLFLRQCMQMFAPDLPFGRTLEIGHQVDAKGLWIAY